MKIAREKHRKWKLNLCPSASTGPQVQLTTPWPRLTNLYSNKCTNIASNFWPGSSRDKYMVRDYSIDEKTNQIFNEFMRQESPVDENSVIQPSPSPNNRGKILLTKRMVGVLKAISDWLENNHWKRYSLSFWSHKAHNVGANLIFCDIWQTSCSRRLQDRTSVCHWNFPNWYWYPLPPG